MKELDLLLTIVSSLMAEIRGNLDTSTENLVIVNEKSTISSIILFARLEHHERLGSKKSLRNVAAIIETQVGSGFSHNTPHFVSQPSSCTLARYHPN